MLEHPEDHFLIPSFFGDSKDRALESINPDPSRLIDALRQIGYSIEQSIADLVDNAISANASNVLIRFVHKDDRLLSISVVDDGSGMTERGLSDAMKFGSRTSADRSALGKFGMGLKLASLSHSKSLTVVTREQNRLSGRRWSVDGIKNGWECEIVPEPERRRLFNSPWSPLKMAKSGTVVKWDQLESTMSSTKGIRPLLRNLHKKLELHLGLHFHRFIESGLLRIHVDQQEEGRREHLHQVEISAINPFGYLESGAREWPKTYSAEIGGLGRVFLEGHIWPANSETKEYRLGGKSAARQGFYFYRNNRLIQAGGWCGLVESEAEPHGSLARVKVDLSPEFDEAFNLNVQKSSVIAPSGFLDAIKSARSDAGDSFESYRHRAEQVYREQSLEDERSYAPHPAFGMPKALSNYLADVRDTDLKRVRGIGFSWKELPEGEFFRLELGFNQICLNSTYRPMLSGSSNSVRNDVPVLKILLFMLLETDLKRTRNSSKLEKKLDQLNCILAEAIKFEHKPET